MKEPINRFQPHCEVSPEVKWKKATAKIKLVLGLTFGLTVLSFIE